MNLNDYIDEPLKNRVKRPPTTKGLKELVRLIHRNEFNNALVHHRHLRQIGIRRGVIDEDLNIIQPLKGD